MKKSIDAAFDIQQGFMDAIGRDYEYVETAKCDESGKERTLLNMTCGFNVELTNQKNQENSAELRCWWHNEEDAVVVDSLEQLLTIFFHHVD